MSDRLVLIPGKKYYDTCMKDVLTFKESNINYLHYEELAVYTFIFTREDIDHDIELFEDELDTLKPLNAILKAIHGVEE